MPQCVKEATTSPPELQESGFGCRMMEMISVTFMIREDLPPGADLLRRT
jgi:hypothetical protein